MANAKHLAKLGEGIDSWNAWVKSQHEMLIFRADLRGADLRGVNLGPLDVEEYFCDADYIDSSNIGADLSGADLTETNLSGAILSCADLSGADLTKTDCTETNLIGADLSGANLTETNLSGAILSSANLRKVNFSYVKSLSGADLSSTDLSNASLVGQNLSDASLCHANLNHADFYAANLNHADLREAKIGSTIFYETDLSNANLSQSRLFGAIFGATDLSNIKGIDDIQHDGPSVVDLRTMEKTSPPLSDHFLRGCGLSDWQISFTRLCQADLSLDVISDIGYDIIKQRGGKPIQLNPIFISYSNADSEFVDRIEKQLNADGIRFWRDVHDATAGRLDLQIERAISLNPTVFIVLSKHSVDSDWVEWEAQKARELEKKLKRSVLCPVQLDDSWKTSNWSGVLRDQIQKYNILEFSNWQDELSFIEQYKKLRLGLGLFYRGEISGSDDSIDSVDPVERIKKIGSVSGGDRMSIDEMLEGLLPSTDSLGG